MHTGIPETHPFGLNWHGWTDRGKVRTNNEDSYLGLCFDAREVQHLGRIGQGTLSEMDHAFAVCDGMGGAKAGEFASRIALEQITRLLPKAFQQCARGLSAGFGDVLTELFHQAHRSLVYVGNSYPECQGMETTLSLCWFTPGWMYFGHVGDSRIYYLPMREGGIRQLSHDDTYVGWLYRNGKINEREARTHPRRSVLQKALGGGNQFVDPQLGAVNYEAGDIFLICSDGVSENLYEHHLLEILRPKTPHAPGENLAEILVKAVLQGEARDNATALVIQVT